MLARPPKNLYEMVKETIHRLLVAVVVLQISVFPTIGCTQIRKFVNNYNGYGKYSFEYETSDGTFRKEDGGLLPGPEGDMFVVRGEYGYIDTNGNEFKVHYVADSNGYRPLTYDAWTRFNDRRIV